MSALPPKADIRQRRQSRWQTDLGTFYFSQTTLRRKILRKLITRKKPREAQHALGIENDEVVKHCFPKTWPEDREQRAHIGYWLESEARFLA